MTEKSRWLALCPKGPKDRFGPRFVWPLDADKPFGERDFVQWSKRCVKARGYPVRMQWRKQASGSLIVEGTLWDMGDDGEHWGHEEEPPTLAEALIPSDGDLYVGSDPETDNGALERALLLFLEKPDVARNALTAIGDFVRSWSTPDELAMKRAADYAADVAAARVESKLEEIMRAAGYDVDEDGEVHDSEETVIPANVEHTTALREAFTDEDLERDEAIEDQEEPVEVVEDLEPATIHVLPSYDEVGEEPAEIEEIEIEEIVG